MKRRRGIGSLVWVSTLLSLSCAEPRVATQDEPPPAITDGWPPRMLWAWHGAHDLRGLHERTRGEVGVAYHARTLHLGPDGRVVLDVRRDPLRLDDATWRMPVVRIEVEPDVSAALFASRRDDLLRAIEPVLREPLGRGLQLDFDAPASFRAEYATLLRALRERLPSDRRLSMTALGSWCVADRWLEDVPVDEIVPMLFGPDHEQALVYEAWRRGALPEPRCWGAVGVREGEGDEGPATRRFVFPRSPWTLARAERVWETSRDPSR